MSLGNAVVVTLPAIYSQCEYYIIVSPHGRQPVCFCLFVLNIAVCLFSLSLDRTKYFLVFTLFFYILWIFRLNIYSMSWGVLFACLPFWMDVLSKSNRCQVSQELLDDQNVIEIFLNENCVVKSLIKRLLKSQHEIKHTIVSTRNQVNIFQLPSFSAP